MATEISFPVAGTPSVPDGIREAVMQRWGDIVVANASVPVRTGNLRDSLHAEVTPSQVVFSAPSAEYFTIVEERQGFMAASIAQFSGELAAVLASLEALFSLLPG